MPANLQNQIQLIIDGRNRRNELYSAKYCHDRIKEVCQDFIVDPIEGFKSANKGFGVDIWMRKDGINYFFDTKTVQSNVGSYSKYFVQIINWYAYFYSRYPQSEAFARVVFPYNPYNNANF